MVLQTTQHKRCGKPSKHQGMKKKGGEERYERHPPPATATHTLHLAHALYRGNTRYDKEVCYRTDTLDTYKKTACAPRREKGTMVWQTTKLNRCGKAKKRGGEGRGMNASRPPRPHTAYTLHTLSIGETHKVRQ